MSRDDRLGSRPHDPAAKLTPEYSDHEMLELGEQLAKLYERRDEHPTLQLADEILRIRNRMRRGPRLHAGEYLQDGRYRLLARRNGAVTDEHWRAWDRVRSEPVRVRVFHSVWVTDPEAVSAFVSRGEALGRLVHPGIGRVLDANRSDEGFVYVATQVEEPPNTLNADIEETGDLSKATLEPIDIVQATIEAAQALEYAHSQGVVHGDLRPFHILLTNDRQAQVVGFAVQPRAPQDGTASLYRAPEATEPGYEPQPAGDVYALAMTAIAALHHGPLPVSVMRDPGPLIRSLKVPEATRVVLAKATDWDLSVRYPTMHAMLDDWLSDPELVSSLAARARELSRNIVAAEHYETLLSLQPGRAVEIRTSLGDLYITLGDYERALEHLLTALERSSDVEALFPRLRVAGAHTGQWARVAEALWSQARVRDAGRRVVLRMELARINEVELNDPSAAAESWAQVLADHRTPEQADAALRALMRLAEARLDWASAIGHARELLAFVRGEARAKVEFAIGRIFLERLGDEVRGLEYIDRAEAADYHELELAAQLQQIRARRGEWRRLVKLMQVQAAAQEITDASPTLIRAGVIASAVHLEEDAVHVYRSLLERAPRHVVALRYLARHAVRQRDRDRAVELYERLWDTYKGRDVEEPEASERAADCCAYARLLVDAGHPDDAVVRLQEGLRLDPNHVPSLQLAAPLYLERGDVVRATHLLERLMSLFKSVDGTPATVDASIGLGDLAWYQGRLTLAASWFNRALELESASVPAWWGLAKVALASRGGAPGADRAPWVGAAPKRFTPYEGIARLLAGALEPAAMRTWLERTALGRVLVECGDAPARLACGVVDVLIRHHLVTSDLLVRLSQGLPGWSAAVNEIRSWWSTASVSQANATAMFAARRSYDWSHRVITDDFPPDESRSLLHVPLASPSPRVDPAVGGPDAWTELFRNHFPQPPGPRSQTAPIRPAEEPLPTGPVGALVRDGALWLALRREQDNVSIGSADGSDLRISDDASVLPRHGRLTRLAGRVYIEAFDGARVQVDGDLRTTWRLIGGERVTIGETRLQYQSYEDESALLALTPRTSGAGGGARGSSAPPPATRLAPPSNPVVSEPRRPAAPPAAPPGAPPPARPTPPTAAARTAAPAVAPASARPPAPWATAAAPERPPEGWQSPPPPPPAPPNVTASLPISVAPVVPQPAPAPGGASQGDFRSDSHSDSPTAPVVPPGSRAGAGVDAGNSVSPSSAPTALPPSRRTPVPAPQRAGAPIPARPAPPPPPAIAPPALLTPSVPPPAGAPRRAPPASGSDASERLEVDRAMQRRIVEAAEADEGPTNIGYVPPVLPPVLPSATVEADLDDDEPSEEEVVEAAARRPGLEHRLRNPGFDSFDDPEETFPTDVMTRAALASLDSDVDYHLVEEPNSDDSKPMRGPVGPTLSPFDRDDAAGGRPGTRDGRDARSGGPAAAATLRGSLEFMSGKDRGRRVEITHGLTIGQSRTCGISIPTDLRLSAVHCRIERSSDGFVLVDEGSANGTVVNGQRVTRSALTGGEVIMVGRTVLRFRMERS